MGTGMDEFTAIFAPARNLGGVDILVAILLSFILSLALATVYRWS